MKYFAVAALAAAAQAYVTSHRSTSLEQAINNPMNMESCGPDGCTAAQTRSSSLSQVKSYPVNQVQANLEDSYFS